MFFGLTIFDGMMWGKVTWGVFWRWEPRLVATTVLFLTYVGYLVVRSIPTVSPHPGHGQRGDRLMAVVNIPITHKAVDWWRGLHQGRAPWAPSIPRCRDPAVRRLSRVVWCSSWSFALAARSTGSGSPGWRSGPRRSGSKGRSPNVVPRPLPGRTREVLPHERRDPPPPVLALSTTSYIALAWIVTFVVVGAYAASGSAPRPGAVATSARGRAPMDVSTSGGGSFDDPESPDAAPVAQDGATSDFDLTPRTGPGGEPGGPARTGGRSRRVVAVGRPRRGARRARLRAPARRR